MEEQGRASNKIRDPPGGKGGGGKSSEPKGSFVVYLGHWAFEGLLCEVEEEFGFRHEGALWIPYDVDVFEGILRLVGKEAAMCDCSCSSETKILCR